MVTLGVPQHLPARERAAHSRRPPPKVRTAELRPDWACSQKANCWVFPSICPPAEGLSTAAPSSNAYARFNARAAGSEM
jgi:hypothetical protein